MNKEEYTIKLDMIATFEDKQIRVEDLLKQLFDENKQLKEIIKEVKDQLDSPWFVECEHQNQHILNTITSMENYYIYKGVENNE